MADEKKSPSFLLDRKKASAAPDKKTMNFVHHQSAVNLKKIIPLALIALVAVALFLKLGVLDQLNQKTMALNELSAQQAQLDMVNARLATFAELEKEYSRYSYSLMSESETGLVTRLDILSLIEKNIARTAAVKDFAINGNVLTTNISGITLDQASKIVQKLENSELVKSATVYSAAAAAEDEGEASIFMSIVLTKEVEEK